MTAYVYRCFDIDGRLLYVGFTVNVNRRLSEHRNASPWFSLMCRSEHVAFDVMSDALAEERRALREEHPLCNDKGNSSRDMGLVASLVAKRRKDQKTSIFLGVQDVVAAAIAEIAACRSRRAEHKQHEKAVFAEAKARGFTVLGLKRVLRARAKNPEINSDEQLISIYFGGA